MKPEDIENIVERAVSRIEAIIKVPQHNNAGSVTQVMMTACLEIGVFDFTLFEDRLRKVKSRVHLLGRPMSNFPGFKSKVPGMPMEFHYALWVCMNGEGERDAAMEQDGTKRDELVENLVLSGLLTPDK